MVITSITSHLFDKYYYERPDFIGGTNLFHQLCASRVTPGSSILEIGAGPSNETSDFLATVGVVSGLDVSKEVAANRALSSWKLFDGNHMPFEDESFDCCFSNWVLEHVESPLRHFQEVHRILRPGGTYCFRTMNILHYVGAISRFTPHWFHRVFANRARGLAADAHDPWPTFYNCNTLRAVYLSAGRGGFRAITVDMVETEPSYGRASPILFYPMFAWERMVNANNVLRFLRAGIFASVTKASD